MTNDKFLKLAVIAMISSTAFTAQVASASELYCNDWSFGDRGCASYIESSGEMAEGSVQTTIGMQCSDWSFSDPGCPAFPTATAAGGMEPSGVSTTGAAEGPQCSDLSFHDNSCSAFIR